LTAAVSSTIGRPARSAVEASRIVIIVIENGGRTGFKLAEIASEYTSRFHPQSVGILLAPTCAAF